ncbi:MAG: bifunctional (p)ppGpp synthetase/guanosine-3',5'-bis(diphosphate) 3'-pyrophosphohydrolase [Oscillospiraceae bacterium]|nr:bifunctional (p)ppGpp synthetase/guanosine-3',5'-bis(diphosphate) 3'-pyrophosphohydrolase [Oscillospiraceae bacterium]MCM0708410.1 bifunctional (p)ppGpp synthetase/guanosine-3',5'-bis(diphosphate) 3'-pyrophosphohydrolase [Faecalicatena sp. BF-R-105]MDY3219482.1 bifunctional (p)ppGpp synthetase/guanosine-3',5'-bis(diphosphate) 3'-pyrophosphohydrolase [Candidatus Fimivivens sp.]SFI74304.1 GTP pyrophosphokinase [Ruminococcaceae bacterium D5]GKH51094.1 GTP pyrophosphokinase [Eubacteriales bacter
MSDQNEGYSLTFEELQDFIRQSGKNYNLELIEKAYSLAAAAHGEQKRRSGEPYIIHPLAVAKILVELGMDNESIAAALLHDVVEDTGVPLSDIEKQFGHEIALLVNGVTKLGRIPYTSKEEQQAENLRKMLLAMAQDIRVVIIKLADRLHNARTFQYLPDEKRRYKALETMEIYAPIADRLGIRRIKEELEDTSLRYLDPIAYEEIESQLTAREERQKFLASIKQRIFDRVKAEHPNAYIEGRVKSIYGIYRKVYMQGRAFDEVYDIYAVRIIVDSVIECYNILGIIHDMFRPIPNRFKDYISTPKQNMYQSLHTTVFDKEGIPFETQIRTWEMHYTAEYGIAAHWKYKVGIQGKDKLEERLAWVRQLLENQQEGEDAEEIVRSIKSDIAPEEVFVFTPKGDVISLPAGATVLDFAYAIHSAVGNRMVGARIDGKIVSIDTPVQTGMIVEIITSNSKTQGPNRDWLNIVKTTEARNKIRSWFKKERREENIAEGIAMIEREFKRASISVTEEQREQLLLVEAKRQHMGSIEDLLAALGYGGLPFTRIFPHLREEYQRLYRPEPEEKPLTIKPKKERKDSSGVIVEGLEGCLVKFSKCCNPLPGDEIIGFVTRGYGVSIHKKDCINVAAALKDENQKERWVKTEWASNIRESFQSSVEIVGNNRAGLLAELSVLLSNLRVPLHAFMAKELKDGRLNFHVTMTISDLQQLAYIISQIKRVPGVISVDRVSG